MPHSPYQSTVFPPIADLDRSRGFLARERLSYEDDKGNLCEIATLLDVAEDLLKQCDFVETKLRYKKFDIMRLLVEKKELKSQNEALEKERETLKQENDALKKANEVLQENEYQIRDAMRHALNALERTTHQAWPIYNETDVDAYFSAALPRPENGNMSFTLLENGETTNLRKRGMDDDLTPDEVGAKKMRNE